ncbi:MAG: Fe-S cluster assembly protein SufD [Chloroflexi bacterium]|nr:Fe-S cluster assembly protein SufD [Chloroflexota bacterium]
MTTTLTKYEKYTSDYDSLQKRQENKGPAWLHDIRERGMNSFSELGLPTARRGNEKWKYTNVGPIASATFSYPADASVDEATLAEIRRIAPLFAGSTSIVFVNGQLSESLSTLPNGANGIRAMSLAEAILSGDEVVERHLAKQASVEDDGFIALNTAFLHDGVFVHIPEGKSLESPLHLVFVSTEQEESTVSHPRVLIVAGPNSKATIIESYVGISQNRYFTNAVTEIVLEEGAEIDHHRLLMESEESYHVGVARVYQSDNSKFSSKAFEKGPAIGRYDLSVLLDGPGSYCDLYGLYMTSGRQHMDNYINIDHAKPYGTSRLYYKGILDGRSKAVFGGTVWVREGAIKTDSMQTDKNLVLSPNAEVDSKPALFIYADDVKCGHGATAGNISEDTVFYMRSRGIDLEAASRLLIYGFASEIIDTVRVDEFREYLENLFLNSLPNYKFEF